MSSWYFTTAGSLSLLSAVSSSLIITSCILEKNLRKFPKNLILYLSLCDLAFAARWLVISGIILLYPTESITTLESNVIVCQGLAVWAQISGLGGICWNGMIALNLLLNARYPFFNTQKLHSRMHMYVWSVVGATTLILGLTGGLGVSRDLTCWINTQSHHSWSLFFAPLLVHCVLAVVALISGISSMSYAFTSASLLSPVQQERRRMLVRMILFTAVFLLYWLGALVQRAYITIITLSGKSAADTPIPFEWWDMLGSSSIGFANGLIWLTHPQFRAVVRRRIWWPFYNFMCCVAPAAQFRRRHTLAEPLLRPEAAGSSGRASEPADDLDSNPVAFGDFTGVDVVLRRGVLTALVHGIAQLTTQCSDGMGTPDIEERAQTGSVIEGIAYKTTSLAPSYFRSIRRLSGISEARYAAQHDAESLISKADRMHFSEGKSGAFLCLSKDGDALLKTVSEAEYRSLMDLLPSYHAYLQENPKSLLVRVYGVYKIGWTGFNSALYVVCMANVLQPFAEGDGIRLSQRVPRTPAANASDSTNPADVPAALQDDDTSTALSPDARYDVKGSWVRRGGTHAFATRDDLRLDCDLSQAIMLSAEARDEFLSLAAADAEFLATHNVMDYSMLFGVWSPESVEERLQVMATLAKGGCSFTQSGRVIFRGTNGAIWVAGIIDMFQRYDMWKRAERFAKVYVKCADADGLSVMPPAPYAVRFIERMSMVTDEQRIGSMVSWRRSSAIAAEGESGRFVGTEAARRLTSPHFGSFRPLFHPDTPVLSRRESVDTKPGKPS